MNWFIVSSAKIGRQREILDQLLEARGPDPRHEVVERLAFVRSRW